MKFVGKVGSTALLLALGCAVSAYAREGEKKSPPEQRAKLELQPGLRMQYAESPGVGLIPNDHFRAHFGREHRFHLSESSYGHDRHFQYGGYSFGFVDEWPTNWLSSEDVFVIQIDSGYYLCNGTYPGVRIPLSVAR